MKPSTGAAVRLHRIAVRLRPESLSAFKWNACPPSPEYATLRKHYRDQLDLGSTKATARVAEFLSRKATTEGPQCVTAAIFWMKTRGGWREAPQTHEIALSRDPRDLTDDDLLTIAGVAAPTKLLTKPGA